MSTDCPACRSTIATDDINVSTDLALCRECGKSFRFSEIVGEPSSIGPDLNSPPSGAWYEPRPDGFTVGATTRTWQAAFVIPFTCVWSGFSISGIYGMNLKGLPFQDSPYGAEWVGGLTILSTAILLYALRKMNWL